MHNDEKEYFELFAMNILKEYAKDLSIDSFSKEEKPDLQSKKDKIGIEITIDGRDLKFERELEDIKKPIPDNEVKKFNEKFKKNGGSVLDIKWARRFYRDDDIQDPYGFNAKYFYIAPSYNDTFEEIIAIVNKKSKKLNTIYNNNLTNNRLFIFSPILLLNQTIDNNLKQLTISQEKYKRKFDIIYLCTPDKFYIFDIDNKTYKIIEIDGNKINEISIKSNESIKRKQVKSKKRVADHGEVFTREEEVKAMCDLVKQETERIDSRFLEPACGDGNFLIEILKRKLEIVKKKYKKSHYDYERFSLLALGSIYGVELLEDNVKNCRERLFKYWEKEYKSICKKDYDELTLKSAQFILQKNIVQGNALTLKCVDNKGQDTQIPIVFSEWSYPRNDAIMRRQDYTLDELVNSNKKEMKQENILDTEEDKEQGKFLKEYLSHYKKIFEGEF